MCVPVSSGTKHASACTAGVARSICDAVAAKRIAFLSEDAGVLGWIVVCEESGDVDDPHACRQSQEADQDGEDFPTFLHRFCFLCVGGETGIRNGGLVIGSARGLFL